MLRYWITILSILALVQSKGLSIQKSPSIFQSFLQQGDCTIDILLAISCGGEDCSVTMMLRATVRQLMDVSHLR